MSSSGPPSGAITAIYDAAAAGYERACSSRRRRARDRAVESAFRQCAGSLLEIGCGTGRLLRELPESAVGIDLSREMLRRNRPEERVLQADAHALPFAEGTFDGALAAKGVLRYCDADVLLAELRRVVRPGGLIILHQYSKRTWSLRGRQAADDRHLDRPAELEALLARGHLRPLETRTWRSLSFFPYVLGVPRWLPGRWWSHCVGVARRP